MVVLNHHGMAEGIPVGHPTPMHDGLVAGCNPGKVFRVWVSLAFKSG
ncbi:MAG: hypothetical protein R2857_11165 [Vampirovibrionales bacterium]